MFRHKHPRTRHFAANRRPCKTRINSSSNGATMPIEAYVGSKPIASVGTAISKMLRVNIFLRPTRSPKWAITIPPSGRQITCGKDAERLHLTQPFRDIRREKQLTDNGGKENKNDEVIELKRTA
jgi:hypothetical protein